jgi:protein-S-isoprenylcysteine O-methyltransferase Ste14
MLPSSSFSLPVNIFALSRDSIYLFFNLICYRLLLLACAITLQNTVALAGDVTLNVLVESRDEVVTIAVTNTGSDDAKNIQVRLDLADYSGEFELAKVLTAGKTKYARHSVKLPADIGSYPLITTILYLNDQHRVSVVNVGHFYIGERKELDIPCELNARELHLERSRNITLKDLPGVETSLVLPAEVSIDSVVKRNGSTVFSISNISRGFRANYQIYSVHKSEDNALQICSGRLTTSASPRPTLPIPHWSLLASAFWGVFVACFAFKRGSSRAVLSIDVVAAIRYGSSLALASLVLLFYLEARIVSDFLLPLVYRASSDNVLISFALSAVRFSLNCLYFDGGDYYGFFAYFAFPIFIYMLLGNYWVLRYLILPHKLKDKYWYLYTPILRFFLRCDLPDAPEDNRYNDDAKKLRRVAILSSLVKIFYIPLVTSWVHNEIVFLSGVSSFNLNDFNAVSNLAIRALIGIDVGIFAFGYLTELPQLKNQIRSVENTFLGWIVCIMCYPPLNYVSFSPIDYKLFDSWQPLEGRSAQLASLAVIVLWAVYAWASVALGSRASNLTNRGIVSNGPYRYVRHPAYCSKVILWGISGCFLGAYNFFLVLGFIAVYSLRAWTEERHLGSDPDYRSYCEKVKYRFIPWVI